MGKLMNLAVYNPAILDDDDFLAGYVARGELTERLLARLREITPGGLAAHHLILGQRGMGKTSLLRRLALGIENDPDLSRVLLPLTFREEQYNVHNLHTFWCNCLDALADRFEKTGQTDKADRLDREVAALGRPGNDPAGDDALAAFKAWTKKEDRRPLLLLDNIDLILDGLPKDDWSLRRLLQEAGGIVVVGAAASYLEATADPKGAFYDFFQITVLERLGSDDLLACLRRLAEARGEEGRKVLHVINTDSGRIRTLYDLTGGNPRTLVLLYMMLEMDAEGDVINDLERLLDQVTVLYKARVEDLAPQARVVLDAVALAWDPVPAADVALATGLKTPAVSAQLDRLLKSGILEKVQISTTARAAFQIGERFFNIWYLMRHGPRRQRARLRWLSGFLRNFYSPRQLTERATDLLKQQGTQGRCDYCLALCDAVEDGDLRNLLGLEARRELERLAAEQGKQLEEIVDLRDMPQARTAKEWFGVGWWLHTQLGRYEEAEQAYRQAINIDPKFAWPWYNLGNLLKSHLGCYEEAEQAYRQAIKLDPKYADPWNALGNLLKNHLGCYEKAEQAYQQAINLDPKYAFPWNNLGNLLQGHLGRYEEAEQAYRQAIKLDPKDADPWNGLANLLQDHLGRYEEAEQAYRQAININPKYAWPWNGLGNLLRDHLGRYEEAEQAYRQAIKLDPKYARPWNGLANLLKDHLGRDEEAEQAYRCCLELDSDNIFATDNLAYLLLPLVERSEEGEVYFQQAMDKLPPHGAALLQAFYDFSKDNFGAAVISLNEALSSTHPEIFSNYYDDLLRVLWIADARGYGDKLLAWLDQQGLSERHWPLRATFDAYVHGEERLMDVNPEVRGAARHIYARLDAIRRGRENASAKKTSQAEAGKSGKTKKQ